MPGSVGVFRQVRHIPFSFAAIRLLPLAAFLASLALSRSSARISALRFSSSGSSRGTTSSKSPSFEQLMSLVRYRANDYSVPVAYGHRDVLVKGYVDQVVISCGTEIIARHPRSYEGDDFVYDPIHYPPLLERKPGALDQAAPLQAWDLPEEFGTLRRLLESRMGRRGKREFVQVLRLLETFSQQEVHRAVRDAIRLGALSFDAVKHLALCRLEGRPPRLDLELYPYLPRVRVGTTSAKEYMTLLSGRAA